MMALALQHPMMQMRNEISFFIEQLEDHLIDLNQSSHQSFQRFSDHLKNSLREWQRVTFRTKQQMACLPPEMRKSDIIQQLKQNLEKYEQSVKSFYHKLRSASLNHYEDLSFYLKNLKENINLITEKMDAVPEQSILKQVLKEEKDLPARNRLQWGRKFFHVGQGLFGLWLYAYSGLTEWTVIGLLAGYFCVGVTLEVLRRKFPQVNVVICKWFKSLLRERERTRITSATWYLGSMLVVFLLFPRNVCTITLFYVAVGDTAAGVVGSRWGKHKLSRHVSIEGLLAAFTACFLGTYLLAAYGLKPFYLTGLPLLTFSVLGGSIGALSESLFKKWDDNLVIPLVSAPLLWILMKLFVA